MNLKTHYIMVRNRLERVNREAIATKIIQNMVGSGKYPIEFLELIKSGYKSPRPSSSQKNIAFSFGNNKCIICGNFNDLGVTRKKPYVLKCRRCRHAKGVV